MQKSEQGKLNFSKDPLAKYERTHSQATNIIWASTKKDNRKAWRMKIYVKNMVTKPENPSLSWAFLGCNPQKNGLLPQLPFLTLLFFPLFVSSSASHPRLLLHVPSGRPESSPPSVPFSRLKAAHLRGPLKSSKKKKKKKKNDNKKKKTPQPLGGVYKHHHIFIPHYLYHNPIYLFSCILILFICIFIQWFIFQHIYIFNGSDLKLDKSNFDILAFSMK